jgi:hypothetical protein
MCRKSGGLRGVNSWSEGSEKDAHICNYVVENGFNVCVSCGQVGPAALDVRNTSFAHWASGPPQRIRTQYTRTGRFVNKIIGALNRHVSHYPHPNLVTHLRKRNAKEPEEIIEGIRTWVTSVPRKPYVHATTYADALGCCPPQISLKDMTRIRVIFDEIFFAHVRLKFTGPNFPMTELLHLICETFCMDEETLHVVRYAKRLRCETRTLRYREMYMQCLEYIATHHKLDLDIFKCRLCSKSLKSFVPM